MKRVVVLGQPNVGKTLFSLQFATYLGLKKIAINFLNYQLGCYEKTYTLKQAEAILVSNTLHQTRDTQSIIITLPWGKGKKQFELIDTVGLTDGIDQNKEIRHAMAQTLREIRQADLVFHLLDCERIANLGMLKGIGEIDYQIAKFSQLKRGYLILANKIDLPQSDQGLKLIKQEFPGEIVIPISALERLGFKEVKNYVKQYL